MPGAPSTPGTVTPTNGTNGAATPVLPSPVVVPAVQAAPARILQLQLPPMPLMSATPTETSRASSIQSSEPSSPSASIELLSLEDENGHAPAAAVGPRMPTSAINMQPPESSHPATAALAAALMASGGNSTSPTARAPLVHVINRTPSPGYKKPKRDKKVLPSRHPDYLKMILTAPIYDLAKETPLQLAENLTARLSNTVFLKREDMQPVFSFKIRGAYYKLKSLTPEERARGVVCASAGNHAQGVALAATKLGIKSVIVMPTTSPEIKRKSVRRFGGEIVLSGIDLKEAQQEAARLEREMGYVNIPAYDDPYIIAGQGTCGMEIMRQLPDSRVDAIFVCCGGGGLLAGIAAYVKRLYPEVRVIGVEEMDQNSMHQALLMGHPITMMDCDLFADGTAVRRVGDETFRLVQEHVDEMVLVSNDEICAAIKDVFEDTRSIVEPSGALSLAGCKRWLQENGIRGGRFVAITSGANMNFGRLRFVAERAEIGDETEALVSVMIPERPGSFLALVEAILPRQITELSYRGLANLPAHVFASFKVAPTANRDDEVASIFDSVKHLNMSGVDVSRNEVAKSHARYLVGGRSYVPNERVFRFEFREQPGIIRKLLTTFRDVSVVLFHYRSQGGDIGKVLMGIQVPPEMSDVLARRLAGLNMSFVEETQNEVYRHFLLSDANGGVVQTPITTNLPPIDPVTMLGPDVASPTKDADVGRKACF
ncbi:threonine ammonia-lyase, biosynthetic [Allomyces macrogynus ATCC 38327]|uniref:Threonine dehydratase n=1 Tax=Allomyces macrogynus (strain ATCC 38327) TaxID=578462 RepID=A0A0L0SA06_ALLM3|nr:threonine ammonia-lyase, biosynthetic [Allomyces macrogynus ATCC 38327]|eukprot:KNE59224.1 threonine ammonia-lyase, biosynthetic [Allomyces macrogynus ATCC 38327]